MKNLDSITITSVINFLEFSLTFSKPLPQIKEWNDIFSLLENSIANSADANCTLKYPKLTKYLNISQVELTCLTDILTVPLTILHSIDHYPVKYSK